MKSLSRKPFETEIWDLFFSSNLVGMQQTKGEDGDHCRLDRRSGRRWGSSHCGVGLGVWPRL